MFFEMRSDNLPLRIIITESDPVSSKIIVELLSKDSSNCIVEQCANGFAAMSAIQELKPDVMICEVETAGIDGFALLEMIPPQNRLATIFISNRNDFAARAFEVSAVDYLVKPLTEERLNKALERARYQLNRKKALDISNKEDRISRPLTIKSGRCLLVVKSDELDWAEAEGKYVRLHMGKESLLLKMSISTLEAELHPAQFVRIHRSTIINVDRVRWVQPCNNRRAYVIILQDGTRLALSRRSKLQEITGTPISSLTDIPSIQ